MKTEKADKNSAKNKRNLYKLKEQYAEIIHKMIDGVFLKDVSGRYQLINSSAARVVGKKIKDFIGKRDIDIFPEEIAREFVKVDRKIFKTKKTVKFERRLVCEGKEIYLETVKYPILDYSGKPILLCGFVKDITKRKKEEKMLAKRIKELDILYKVSKILGSGNITKAKYTKRIFNNISLIFYNMLDNADFFVIVWLFGKKKERKIQALHGLRNLKEAKRYLYKDDNFSIPLKNYTKKEGAFLIGRKNHTCRISRAEKNFFNEAVELINNELERSNVKEDLNRMFINVVKSLSFALDARDHYTINHSKRISNSARLIAEKLNFKPKQKENIVLGALLHDIGKIGISDGILSKPAKLSTEEFDKIKQHPLMSERILRPITPLRGTLKIIRYHHEHYDGAGYPDGLSGAAIPIGARILAVCDAYDAMVSERPYRKAMSMDAAALELKKNSGTQFDPEIVKIMLDLLENGKLH